MKDEISTGVVEITVGVARVGKKPMTVSFFNQIPEYSGTAEAFNLKSDQIGLRLLGYVLQPYTYYGKRLVTKSQKKVKAATWFLFSDAGFLFKICEENPECQTEEWKDIIESLYREEGAEQLYLGV